MDGLTTLDKDTYRVPDERIASEPDARLVINQLREADKLRAPKRAKMQGMIDGNPPYNPRTLRDKGQGHRTNFNTRDAEGMADTAKTPYYSLVFSVPQFAQIKWDYGNVPSSRSLEWGNIIGIRYHEMLDNWEAMDFQFQLHHYELCVYGNGPLCWPDARDWCSEAVKAGQFLVPDDTPADIYKLETAVRPRSLLPGALYQSIKDEKAAKTAGWNVKRVKQAIVDAAPEQPTSRNNWEYYQNQIRAGDVTWNAKSKRIFVSDLFQKEFDGTVSHYIVQDDDNTATTVYPNGQLPTGEFLFKKRSRFDDFCQIICPFFFDVGTGDWHTIKGLGPKIYDCCNTFNMLTCDMIDGARLGSGITLKAQDGNALQETQIVPVGGANVIQPGYDAVQTRLAENLQGPLAVKRDLQMTLQSNTGQYRQRVAGENQEPTLGQAQLNVQQQGMLGQGSANRYYKTLDAWHRETLRRALAMGVKLFKSHKLDVPDDYSTSMTYSERLALRFVQSCVRDGVPLEALKMEYICSIKATRAVGYGSPQAEQVVTQGLMELLPMVGPRERNNILRRRAAMLVGQTNVDSVVSPYEQADVPDDQQWAATLENNALRQMGGQVEITDSQDDATHFGVHFQDVQDHIQQSQGGQSDPMQLLIHLEQAGVHMNQHLARMAGDPSRKDMVDQARQAIVMMSKMSDQLKKQLAQAMAAQAAANPPQEQPDPDLVKVLGDLKLKGMKNQGDLQLKAQKQEQQMRLKDLQAAHTMRLKTATTVGDQHLAAQNQATSQALAAQDQAAAQELAQIASQDLAAQTRPAPQPATAV